MKNHHIRQICPENAEKTISELGFDRTYLQAALEKYRFKLIKISDLSCQQATIIKQTALSSGADAAVHREVLIHGVESTDLVLGGTVAELETVCDKLKKQPFSLNNIATEISRQLSPKKHKYSGKTYIMGILNVTPDSFSDGGKFMDPDVAIRHAQKMIENGADIIDIGGESTRPFSEEVSSREELTRVLPVIEKIRDFDLKIPLSIDTRHAIVAQEAVRAGVNIINDISGLEWDEKMSAIAAETSVDVVIMHSLASPQTMQINPVYDINVVESVYRELFRKTQRAIAAGVNPDNIIIDPGIGFGKTFDHNIELIRRIGEFKSLGYPVLIGLSRKSFVSKMLNAPPDGLEEANIALNTFVVAHGADIIRVHDVDRHSRALKALREVLPPHTY